MLVCGGKIRFKNVFLISRYDDFTTVVYAFILNTLTSCRTNQEKTLELKMPKRTLSKMYTKSIFCLLFTIRKICFFFLVSFESSLIL